MAQKKSNSNAVPKNKIADLERDRVRPEGTLTTDQAIPISHTDDSLKAGVRGPTLLEDFHFREKMTRFDHERIPERVVHARGSGAHGYFQVYESLADLTTAGFLCDPSLKTPVFVRFSTVQGSRGSADTVRDVRGFATKFYTREGNFDLVGNNLPVFFVQDGIKFPDFVHAVKPEPQNEIPQGASAHDTFWDFVSLVPESAHMVLWLMSDRAIPRSFAMMEGFGVHTFRLINEKGESHFVKFHWKPVLGIHSLVWDEAQKISGKDPDFHRRALWESIAAGAFPEFELGIQVITEADAEKVGMDLLDVTKIMPEEVVPVRRIGKLTLDRNPEDFFAETEQIAFCVANVVPGIGFTDDPMMQARLFSYLDTQITRLGGPNHAELPINRPIPPVHNNQQDGFSQHRIPTTPANYFPNTIAGGCPMTARSGAYVDFPEPVSGRKTRERSETFKDFFSQAALFYSSLSMHEREHLVDACKFEISKVVRKDVRERAVNLLLAKIDPDLARQVAEAVGVSSPSGATKPVGKVKSSPALSMEHTAKNSVKTRQIAILTAPGVDLSEVEHVASALRKEGAVPHIVAPVLGPIDGSKNEIADFTFLTASSVLFDAIFVPGGAQSVKTLEAMEAPLSLVREAFQHKKPIGAVGEGIDLVANAVGEDRARLNSIPGIVIEADPKQVGGFATKFLRAIAQHRFWERSNATEHLAHRAA